MAQPTVRIHPPKRGDEDWLASMIAPLLDMSADLLAQGFAMGAISVGEGLDADEANDLVDVLRGFGAEAERIDGQRRPTKAPTPPPPTQTQPFDGGHLRRLLAATPEQRQILMARPQNTGPVARPVRRSVPPPAQRAPAPPKPAPAQRKTATTQSGPPPRVSGPVVGAVAQPRSDAQPRPAAPARSAAQANPAAQAPAPVKPVLASTTPSNPPARAGHAGVTSRPPGDMPPWFPQVPLRPKQASEDAAQRSYGWVWILVIMLLAGAAAWYLQTMAA